MSFTKKHHLYLSLMASLLSSQVSSSTSQRSFRKRSELFQGCPALSLLICNFSLLYMLKNNLA